MAEERKPAGVHPDDQKRALLEAAQAAVADARSRSAATSRPQGFRVPIAVLTGVSTALLAGSAWLLVTRPAWFLDPPPPTPSEEVREASLRLTMVREANRLAQFRIEKNRLPESLVELGSPVAGIEYERRGDSVFVLRAQLGSREITMASTDSVAGFLGQSVNIVAPRRSR
jgi:hypothetical protein